MKIEPLAHTPPAQATILRYFIADLHLDGLDTERAQNFRELLQRLGNEAAQQQVELYIIGDLFEYWYEYRKALYEIYRADLAALEAAAKAGVKIFLFFGNRDFIYGKYVRRRFGATVLGDGEAVTLNDGRPVWLEHGDLLCTADKRYLRFRSVVRSLPMKAVLRLMPWSFARNAIDKVRKKAAADKASKPANILEIDLNAARRRLEDKGCKLLICGHTHKALSEDLGAGYRLIVLTPWCDKPAGMIDNGAVLKPFEL